MINNRNFEMQILLPDSPDKKIKKETNMGNNNNHENDGASNSTFKGYMTGFVLAIILTALPFWFVMGKVFETSSMTGMVVIAFAAVQMVIHMIYFLHMNKKSEEGWSIIALIFTIILIVIMLSGSIWVLYNLNRNMMPTMPNAQEMRNMP